MANEIFNVAKGKWAAYFDRVNDNDPTNAALVIKILKVAEADATLRRYDTFAAILAGSNTEADFTNYADKVLTDADISAPTVNDTDDRMEGDLPDQTYTSAGGATNNTTAKAIVNYVSDSTSYTDSDLIPLFHYDFVYTTDGNDLPLIFNSGGSSRSS